MVIEQAGCVQFMGLPRKKLVMIKRFAGPLAVLFLFLGISIANAHESAASAATAHYMANEGLMVVQGETKVVFDPLFRNSYGQYQLLPKHMEEALFAGEPPFDGIDAIFVSHIMAITFHLQTYCDC